MKRVFEGVGKWIKKRGVVAAALSVIVLAIMVARFLRRDYFAVFLCVLTLFLFNLPVIAHRVLKITLPKELQITVLLFVFAAEILGEIGSFYTYVPWWDTMLHAVNGFLMAAIGFSLIDILNNSPHFHISLSPVFVAVVAFCFSMTIGVLWEFFEFVMDSVFSTDMQKDTVISSISSVLLNPDGKNEVVHLTNISETVLMNGDTVIRRFGGYIDVGIVDTMKDLIVNCIGAIVFSAIGYFYIIGRDKGRIAKRFIPQYDPESVKAEKEEREKAKKTKVK